MFIPYEFIGKQINKLLKSKRIADFFYLLKIKQNVQYINKNKLQVLKNLKAKMNNQKPLNVFFYVYDETKWKCQSLYKLLSEDSRFNVKVLVTKNSVTNKNNPNYQSNDDVQKTFDFFKDNYNTEYAYNIDTSKHIPLKKFNPDIIFYQHPWNVKTVQGPVVCSKYALTCYIPYYFPIETADIDCCLRFHDYIEYYYILDNYTKQKYEQRNARIKDKLRVVGYPYLDYFNDIRGAENQADYIIYAPHWTVGDHGLAYSTFEWSGQFILEYAKSHPEKKWIFKPHPLLYKALIDFKIMTESEVKKYYSEWDNLGIRYESGDYLKLFEKSAMMITDCSSFLGEYFVSGKPLIHLMSEKSQFRTSDNPILKTYYRADNLDELKILLDILPKDDSMKNIRVKTLQEIGLKDNNASKKILEDILNEINTAI